MLLEMSTGGGKDGEGEDRKHRRGDGEKQQGDDNAKRELPAKLCHRRAEPIPSFIVD